jgi:cellulose synthase/poly-beta-1,6-N-acetylglucosamine synthase-like glycosyltransferase
MILLWIAIILLILYEGLIIFYWRSWKSIKDYKPGEDHPSVFVTVIVPARNEEKNIPQLLQALSRQSYSCERFEIIVVDDFSTDATAEIVRQFKLPNLHLIQPVVDSNSSSKKKAIESAIQIAKGELIVTTDADCLPGPDWLYTISSFYEQHNAAFIAAPVTFLHDHSLLQIFQAMDFLTLQGITAASVAAHFHSMCNGANLAYTRKAFLSVNGFEGIDQVATGDDMLLMYKIWKQQPDKVFYLKSKSAIMPTQPMFSWKDFFLQRKRWASKTLVYDDHRIIAVLAFIYLLNCFFFVLIIASFFYGYYAWYALGYWIIKTFIEAPFVSSVAKFYKEEKLMRYFFFLQPLHMLYTVSVGFLSQMGKYEWKGRKTK